MKKEQDSGVVLSLLRPPTWCFGGGLSEYRQVGVIAISQRKTLTNSGFVLSFFSTVSKTPA